MYKLLLFSVNKQGCRVLKEGLLSNVSEEYVDWAEFFSLVDGLRVESATAPGQTLIRNASTGQLIFILEIRDEAQGVQNAK